MAKRGHEAAKTTRITITTKICMNQRPTASKPLPRNPSNTVTADLSGVSNARTITITPFDVRNGANTNSMGVRMGVLLGDVYGNKSVTGSDVNDAKAQVGADLTISNFRSDINTTGFVGGSDVDLTKTQVGTSLP